VSNLLFLIPLALLLGALWLGTFLWTLKSGQYDDLDGAAHRILGDEERPLPPAPGERH
jgi:cbb3-type cytochrome oxidase maturation protein